MIHGAHKTHTNGNKVKKTTHNDDLSSLLSQETQGETQGDTEKYHKPTEEPKQTRMAPHTHTHTKTHQSVHLLSRNAKRIKNEQSTRRNKRGRDLANVCERARDTKSKRNTKGREKRIVRFAVCLDLVYLLSKRKQKRLPRIEKLANVHIR